MTELMAASSPPPALLQDDDDHEDEIPDYDDLIESALDSLDVYQARCADMNKHLKNAYFNLAQAKQALGPARVGPASYRLGRTEPLITVDVGRAFDGSVTYTLVQATPARRAEKDDSKGKGKQRAPGTVIDLRLDASMSALKPHDKATSEKGEGPSVRKRVKNILKKQEKEESLLSTTVEGTAGSDNTPSVHRTGSNFPNVSQVDEPTDPSHENKEGNEDAAPPPTYTDSVNEHLLDPMQQFSAFPPVTLRKAQGEFRHGLRIALKVLEDQQNFDKISASAMSSKGKDHKSSSGT